MRALPAKMFYQAVMLIALSVSMAAPAQAQSCALCHTQAASETSRFIEALREGIWILIFPSFFVCTALASMAYRRRDRFHEDDAEHDTW
jgi:hypothetical protein